MRNPSAAMPADRDGATMIRPHSDWVEVTGWNEMMMVRISISDFPRWRNRELRNMLALYQDMGDLMGYTLRKLRNSFAVWVQ